MSVVQSGLVPHKFEADILLIEDEDLMAALVGRYVEGVTKEIPAPLNPENLDQFKLTTLSTGWELFDADLSQVKIAIVDILLPRVSGVDIIRDIRKRYPHIGIIPISGMATEPMKRILKDLVPELGGIVAKPLRKQDFQAAFYKAWNFRLNQLQQPGPNRSEEAGEELWTAARSNPEHVIVAVEKRKLVRKAG